MKPLNYIGNLQKATNLQNHKKSYIMCMDQKIFFTQTVRIYSQDIG